MERESYVMVFVVTPEGRVLKEVPFEVCTEKRPPALAPGEPHVLPDAFYPEPEWCRYFVRDLAGLHVAIVIASESRLAIPYSSSIRDGYEVDWLQANSLSEAIDLILDALGDMPEGSWWAGTFCFFTVLP